MIINEAPKRYAVIIRCYNEEKYIGRLLAGILEQSIKPEEIIVVDSGSNDATLSIVSRFPAKIVRIEKEKFSFGKALNIGCSHAQAPFLLFASGHVYPVYKNWTELLLEPFKDERVGLVYGKQRGNENTRYSEHCIWKHWFPDDSEHHQKYPFCNNANAAIRRLLWEQFPFSEELTGLEDLDWGKRIAEKGNIVVYQPAAEVKHVHNETFYQVFNRYYREAMSLKKIYPEQSVGKREFIHLLVSNICFDLFHAFKDGVFLENIKEVVLFRLMQFTGTYRGFHDGKPETNRLKEQFYYPKKQRHSKQNSTFMSESKIDYSKIYKNNER